MSEGFDRALRRELVSGARRRRADRWAGWGYPVALVALLAAVVLGLGETLPGRVALVGIGVGLGAAYGVRMARRILTDLSRSIDSHEL